MNIKIFIVDCDGCLTDGKLYYTEAGKKIKAFNSKDGIGLQSLMRAGVIVGIVSGDDTGREIINARARDLKLDFVSCGVTDKYNEINKILLKYNLKWQNVAFFGDDINDAVSIQNAYYSFCPNDAHSSISKIVNYVCKKNGGEGCVREACDYIIENEV